MDQQIESEGENEDRKSISRIWSVKRKRVHTYSHVCCVNTCPHVTILIQLRPIKGHDHSTATDCTYGVQLPPFLATVKQLVIAQFYVPQQEMTRKQLHAVSTDLRGSYKFTFN